MPTEDEGSASGTISGTVTLTGSASWSNLKVGFFPRFTETSTGEYEEYLEDDYVDESFSRIDYTSYLTYEQNKDGSSVDIAAVKSLDISGNTGTSYEYNFSLPNDPLKSNNEESYYYSLAIWRDSDGDNQLDLYDLGWLDRSADSAGEYTRLPLKDFGGTSLASVSMFRYIDDGNNVGYKYTGYDGETNYIDFVSKNSNGYNFTVEK